MYGKKIKHLSKKGDKYGFVNETEIRIAAGVSLIFAMITFFVVMLKGEFIIGLYVVGILWLDFVLKVFFGPEFSIFGVIVKPFIKKSEKNWVGSVQKRFAWSIGLVLSSFVMFCLFVLGGFIGAENQQIINLLKIIQINIANNSVIVTPMNPAVLACILCMIFMWFEAVVGFCVGCKMYKNLVSEGIMKEHKGQNCVNGACEIKK